MYRVLLPVDENESRARSQATAVRTLPNAAADVSVDVLHVSEGGGGPDAEWAAGGFAEEYADEMERLHENDALPESVETAVDVLDAAEIEWTFHAATGDPPDVILASAAEYDSDQIILGVQHRSPVGKVLFGSVAQAVILGSDRPVTVVPAK
ncbi:universal stress protein [Natrinema salifodinae]|uniref:Nucleotide-binding universal stress protein, UspA family n=1 Tax=Natrinema salifodinae TaxID=1202768 RepID=A0A1I0M6R7_9EURY|nr:universal stress protein [Natrinema salifodinae]SEV83051.1 Nucleotide-binding universal stress protein, UspA family [Natrinema salifodinae]